MRELSLDQLRTFQTVVALGGFTAAARRLNYSQSAVSTQIRELERRLGVRLIDRVGKKAFATAAGFRLLEHARRIDREAEDAVAAMKRHRQGRLGRVRIGAQPSVATYVLPRLLQAVRRQYSDIEIIIRTGLTEDLAPLVADNQLDLCVGTPPRIDRRLTVTALYDEPMFAVLPASARDACDPLTPAGFEEHDLILDGVSWTDRTVRDWFWAAGIEAKPVMELSYIEAIKNVVAAGLGVSVLPACVLEDRRDARDLVLCDLDPPITRPMVLVERRDRRDDPALDIVRHAVLSLGEKG
ncbi:LysR family transcriptional regulator [Pelagibius sp.]|uniref:LysR family transcriptional regulator n=1 Tax=Pelagibius sp. TaxID=1931238 RepID=UPI003B506FB9